jgi:hypothetical protein
MRFGSSPALRTPPPPAPAARGTRLHLAHAPPRPLTAHSEPPKGRVEMLAPPAPRRFRRVLRRVMRMVFTMVGRRGAVRRTPAARNPVRDDERCASCLYRTVERCASALYGDRVRKRENRPPHFSTVLGRMNPADQHACGALCRYLPDANPAVNFPDAENASLRD